MQTSQDLAATIADSNAKNAAAANPTLAAWEAVALAQDIGSSSSRPSSATQNNSGYSPTNSGANTDYAALLQQMLAAMNPANSSETYQNYSTTNYSAPASDTFDYSDYNDIWNS
jgi:hypothetical protein